MAESLDQNWHIDMDVSREQFIQLATEFRKTAERAFGTDCKLELEVLYQGQIRGTSRCPCDDVDDVGNDLYTLLDTDKLEELTPSCWKEGSVFNLKVIPTEKDKTGVGDAAYSKRSQEVTFHLSKP